MRGNHRERKTESYIFSDFGNDISRDYERKSIIGRFATGHFAPILERFLLTARSKSITENFVHGKLRPSFVFVVFQRIFSS